MDSVGKVILVLPFLAILDVVAALYVRSLNHPLVKHEVGLFASLFGPADLVFTYIFVVSYLILFFVVALVLWGVKIRLNPSDAFGKVVFLLVLLVVGALYVVLSEGFIINLFLPSILEKGIDLYWLSTIVYLSALFCLVFYVWSDTVSWVKYRDEERKQ